MNDKKRAFLTTFIKIFAIVAALAFLGYTVYYFATIGKQVEKIKSKYDVASAAAYVSFDFSRQG